MSVAFRPDSGPAKGLGHVQRCLALAAALAELGVECTFAVPEPGEVASRIERAGFAARELEAPVVVLDSYEVTEMDLRALRDAGRRVVLVDDHATLPAVCDVCVNGGAHAESLVYAVDGVVPRFLLGPRFALLQPQLWDVVPRPPAATVGNVLVTLGGSDPDGLAPTVLAAVDAVDADFTITVAVGPFFPRRDELGRGCRHEVELLDAPASLVEPMRRADLAVSAAGQTVYELLRLGVPTAEFVLAENQRAGLAALAAAGAVRETRAETITATVSSLVGSAATRRALAARAGALLDGQGARRVARVVQELLERSCDG